MHTAPAPRLDRAAFSAGLRVEPALTVAGAIVLVVSGPAFLLSDPAGRP